LHNDQLQEYLKNLKKVESASFRTRTGKFYCHLLASADIWNPSLRYGYSAV